ncbi:hypothetical protein [Niabella drilacis]|uniref:hypothetical protein n=1 Tax=Niabella drilacis (strain DSM 25811 / CCM 8410 / CCUG 62505 / LMG 26954 / E90) TaxID=1285928 RepID=UPI00373FCC5D
MDAGLVTSRTPKDLPSFNKKWWRGSWKACLPGKLFCVRMRARCGLYFKINYPATPGYR